MSTEHKEVNRSVLNLITHTMRRLDVDELSLEEQGELLREVANLMTRLALNSYDEITCQSHDNIELCNHLNMELLGEKIEKAAYDHYAGRLPKNNSDLVIAPSDARRRVS